MSPWLWRRKFTRDQGLDEDSEADPDLLNQLSESHDFFSEWLQQGQNAQLLSLNAVLSHFWSTSALVKSPTLEIRIWRFHADNSADRSQEFDFHVFCVADGGSIDWSPEIADWFNPHIRFIAVIVLKGADVFSTDSWTLCIVGSSSLDSKDAFLQVASWNGQVFRFFGVCSLYATVEQTTKDYQRDSVNDIQSHATNVIGWVYQGQSLDAFNEHDSYLGPFNGHVNGACIMKELHT
ncbi:MAG: hypothetical protein HETSPECPRED_010578 [Heterodermia speciosa]|uniref:Uncharacterized protein n=1 Tax=Heterodermia speciosa TaxID=116794 RepID=A0A8H3GC52_9LECA|nr:MAG: hypothetical protein HETSPECPRED_010578 [Heterodermia speciosa]